MLLLHDVCGGKFSKKGETRLLRKDEIDCEVKSKRARLGRDSDQTTGLHHATQDSRGNGNTVRRLQNRSEKTSRKSSRSCIWTNWERWTRATAPVFRTGVMSVTPLTHSTSSSCGYNNTTVVNARECDVFFKEQTLYAIYLAFEWYCLQCYVQDNRILTIWCVNQVQHLSLSKLTMVVSYFLRVK